MQFGEREFELGPIDSDQLVRLIKFTAKLLQEIDEDKKDALLAGIEKSNVFSIINILSSVHIVDLTAILLNTSKKFVTENWNIVGFSELVAEIAEKNDLPVVLKNVQRAAAAFQS